MMLRPKRPRGAAPSAEDIAAKALLFLAEEPQRLGRFIAETGIGPDDLMAGAGSRETLVAVLDHLVRDESALLVFAAGAGIGPEQVMRAHMALSDSAGDEA